MRFRLIGYGFLLLTVSCVTYIAVHWGLTFFRDFIPSNFSLHEPSLTYSGTQGTTINLPQITASVDDGEQFYSLQTTIALELEHSHTIGVIRSRHEVIDRHLIELFRSYSLKDLRSAGTPLDLRNDIKRVVNDLLPEASVRNAYVTNWVMIPAGY